MVEKAVGKPIDQVKLEKARRRAERKLSGLIRRFGDGEGRRRREQWYLAYMIIEELCSDSLSQIAKDLWDFEEDVKK